MQACSLTSRIGAYHDGELDAAAYRAVVEHLDDCPECRAELDDMRQMSLLLGSVEADRLSPAEADALRERAEAMADAPPMRMFGGVLAAAASVLIVCGAWWNELPRPGPAAPAAGTQVAWREAEPWERVAVNLRIESPAFAGGGEAVASDVVPLDDWMLAGLGLVTTGGAREND